MKNSHKDLLNERAAVFKALAHPTRLFIVEKLAKGECCVCKFVEQVGADFSTISKHLSVLKNAGLVRDEKRGQQVFYSLQMSCVTGFINCVDGFLQEKASGIDHPKCKITAKEARK